MTSEINLQPYDFLIKDSEINAYVQFIKNDSKIIDAALTYFAEDRDVPIVTDENGYFELKYNKKTMKVQANKSPAIGPYSVKLSKLMEYFDILVKNQYINKKCDVNVKKVVGILYKVSDGQPNESLYQIYSLVDEEECEWCTPGPPPNSDS